MRKDHLTTVTVAIAIALVSGCTTTTGGSDVDKIIDGTRRVCSFAPTATSILALLNVPAAPAADKVVQMICAQVEKAAMVESTPVGGQLTVVVDGKPVVGVVTKK